MKLNHTIASLIVKRTMQIIPNSVNVMNENGIIIASGDPTRLGQRHIGAVVALRRRQAVEIDENLAKEWQYEAKQGINLPLNYLGSIVGVVGISGPPNEVRQFARLVQMAAELIMEQAFRLEEERWQRRYKEEFVRQLLKGALSVEQIQEQAQFFGVAFRQQIAVALIRLSSPTAEKLQTLLAYFEHYRSVWLTAVLGLDQIAILLPQPYRVQHKKDLIDRLSDDLHFKIVVGLTVEELSEAHLSFQTACNTLAYVEEMQSKKQIFYFDDFRLPALLRHFRHSWEAKTLLSPFEKLRTEDKKQVLVKSLQAYFLSNCELDHASNLLCIHPNTLRYRLERIEQITSLSFNNIEHKLMLYLASLSYRNL